jgi:hypothetical protein
LSELGYLDDERMAAIEAEVRPRSTRRSRSPRSPLEPVEDLERFVTSEVAP